MENRGKLKAMFIIPSAIGVILFMIPVKNAAGEWTVTVKIIADIIAGAIGGFLPILSVAIVTISAVMTLVALAKPKFIMESPVLNSCFICGPFWIVVRVLGAIFAWITFLELGADKGSGILYAISSADQGGFVLYDLIGTLVIINVIASFLLPLLTPQAERGMFSKAFTVDVVTSNRLSGDFYDEADALTYAKNDGDETAAVVSRFWSKQQSACSDLYKQIREVESSDLSDREKRQKTRELKALVNGIQKNAMAVEETYRAAVEKNLQKGMDSDDAYRAANKDCFGAEYALQVYNKDVYEKAKSAKSNGVSYDDYYAYYFGTRGFEKSGDTSVTTQKFDWLQSSGIDLTSQAEIYFADMASDKVLETQAELEMSSGITAVQFYQYKVASSGMTKKAEKMQAINSLNLTSAQKDAIYYAEGWAQSTIRDAPWRGGDGGNYSRESSSSSRYLSYLAEKNGYTLQEAAPSAPRYSGYLQYLAARDGISLDTEDTGSGLQSKYLREFASRWGG